MHNFQKGKLRISHELEAKIGDSIALDGCCLTLTSFDSKHMVFDISKETMERTHFRNLQSGQQINLERALRLKDRLHGHMLAGHVDAVAKIISLENGGGQGSILTLSVPYRFSRYLPLKGSCAVQGVSLTINAVSRKNNASTENEEDLEVKFCLIPETLRKTNLANLASRSLVNFEIDMIARYLEPLLSQLTETSCTH